MSEGMRSILRDISERDAADPTIDGDLVDDDAQGSEGDLGSIRSTTAAASSPGSLAMQSGRARLLRHILLAYFRKHVPEGVHKVEDLVARVVGGAPTAVEGVGLVGGVLWSEAELFAKLEAKYGKKVDLDPQSALE